MKASHFNTLLGCVTWEMVESEEDKFDFAELDKVIMGARRHGIHLVLLWFGSFKKAKTDPKRFTRAKLRKAGGVLETADVVSIFHPATGAADKKAFGKLLVHIKEVENETGFLGNSRDGSVHAGKVFNEPVPADLVDFLRSDWDNLNAEIKRQNLGFFKSQLGRLGDGTSPSGTWVGVFGRSPKTDEFFMAYHCAHYLDDVASAGKASYPLPMYANVWQNYNDLDTADNCWLVVVGGGGGDPGTATCSTCGCASGAASTLSRPTSTSTTTRPRAPPTATAASRSSSPEQRRDEYGARRIWAAYGSHGCMGTAPFGCDTLGPGDENPFTRHYELLESVAPLPPDPSRPMVKHWGGYEVTIERCFVFGRPGDGAGMGVHRGGGRFLLIGYGFQVRARATSARATFTGILRFEEKRAVSDGDGGVRLETLRTLNGDKTRSVVFAVMLGPDPDYGGFPSCVTVPAKTMIAELSFYHLEEE
ncbi:hypothetical protein GGTG_07449 [Gaeumannomyces tritici R3-111a-1]|uniref:DUF5597 domain-containing protein n=1 Tax=Gaeumannomyces tritici (strain R3-111a-1) TaxID=644352 RepID=J3P1Q1_GAET3|nr:hypothetical protein GGTG_07449 [Gaeumannomyces tritici R3-111a-1]EJT73593.1 hypothetical protein GGTG_07449 [Gaeumannomyces tritici R3-111a-1]